MTPTKLNAWVLPLWKARPECRPTKTSRQGNVWTLVFITKPCIEFVWQLSKNVHQEEFDDASAVAIEWHIDRLLEDWTKTLHTFHHTVIAVVVGKDDIGWYVAVYDFGTNLILKKASHKDRLAAKLKLAYDAVGVEPPRELTDA